VPDKENAKHFTGTKNVLEQKPTKALAPTGFLWKPSRRMAAQQLLFIMRHILFLIIYK
jgi:hypothetical protein